MIANDDFINKLATTKLFQGLDTEELRLVMELGEITPCKDGRELITEGRDNHNLYILLEGDLEVYLPETTERFSRVVLGKLKAGDCIGEYSIIDNKPASASVHATSDVVLFALDDSAFTQVLTDNMSIGQKVYRNLLQLLVTRLRGNNKELDMFHPF